MMYIKDVYTIQSRLVISQSMYDGINRMFLIKLYLNYVQNNRFWFIIIIRIVFLCLFIIIIQLLEIWQV